EVDVDEVTPDLVELDLAGLGELVVVAEAQRDQRVHTVGEDQVEVVRRDGHRGGLAAEAVDDGREAALTAEAARGPGAPVGARFSGENDVVGHGATDPFEKRWNARRRGPESYPLASQTLLAAPVHVFGGLLP